MLQCLLWTEAKISWSYMLWLHFSTFTSNSSSWWPSLIMREKRFKTDHLIFIHHATSTFYNHLSSFELLSDILIHSITNSLYQLLKFVFFLKRKSFQRVWFWKTWSAILVWPQCKKLSYQPSCSSFTRLVRLNLLAWLVSN